MESDYNVESYVKPRFRRFGVPWNKRKMQLTVALNFSYISLLLWRIQIKLESPVRDWR